MHRRIPFALVLAMAAIAVAQDPKPAPAPAPTPAPAQAPPANLKVGDTVPADLSLRNMDGPMARFGELRGKTVFIHWWSTTCPSEVVAEPKIEQIAKDYADKGVVVIAINSNRGEIGAEPAAEDFKKQKSEERPYLKLRQKAGALPKNHIVLVDHTGDVARLFKARTTPHCFVIDAAGKLVYTGALDNDGEGEKGDAATKYVRMALDSALAGEPVKTAETRPYG